MRRGSPGVSLIELLGVICIILVLATFAVPAYASFSDQARQAKSLREIQLVEGALEQYKAERGHYPDRLEKLVTHGYLKRSMTFRSPWWSSSNRVHFFYTVNRRGEDIATAYALGDPGRSARCGSPDSIPTTPHPRLDQGATGPVPCGRYPHEPAWVFAGPEKENPTLDLYADGHKLDPPLVTTLAGFCCNLVTEE